ncbi:Sodium-dependent transporter OS=Lysinibacillus sphaericus OX=1421 GN=LS41612_16580 PE=4 SV=1 [Lysinibacillus sphaericus]
MSENKGQWSSKLGFILASAGAAIGLGAIWKYPMSQGKVVEAHFS